MAATEKQKAVSGRLSGDTEVTLLPINPSEVAQRLQRRLSGFALVMHVVCRDLDQVQGIVQAVAAGFAISDDDRHALDGIALRMFDAKEALT